MHTTKVLNRPVAAGLDLCAELLHGLQQVLAQQRDDAGIDRHAEGKGIPAPKRIADKRPQRRPERCTVVHVEKPPNEPRVQWGVMFQRQKWQAAHQEVGGGDQQRHREEERGVEGGQQHLSLREKADHFSRQLAHTNSYILPMDAARPSETQSRGQTYSCEPSWGRVFGNRHVAVRAWAHISRVELCRAKNWRRL